MAHPKYLDPLTNSRKTKSIFFSYYAKTLLTLISCKFLSNSDYIKSCASLEVCRQVIVAFDSSGLGRITFSNFKDLMCSLKLWHGVFKNNAKEKSGILIADRLRDALSDVGFQLNSSILSVLMMRYIRKDGTLRFGDFVAIILNLSIAFDGFEKRDLNQQGTIRVNRAEVSLKIN